MKLGFYHEKIRSAEVSEELSIKINQMRTFVTTTRCRREYILNYFGESSVRCDRGCDNCLRPTESRAHDLTFEAKLLLGAIRDTGGRFGQSMISILPN